MVPRLVERRRPARPGLPAGWARTLAACLAPAGRADWPLDVVLVTDEEMAALNRGYRRLDGPTDVLSFGYLAAAGEGPPDLPAARGGARRDLWRDAIEAEAGAPVGEVVLAPAHVAAGCRREGWSYDLELTMLVVHGALHVLGWEHGDAGETGRMREREAGLLQEAGLPHPLLEGGGSARWTAT